MTILATAYTLVTIEPLPIPHDEDVSGDGTGIGSGTKDYAFIDFDEGI